MAEEEKEVEGAAAASSSPADAIKKKSPIILIVVLVVLGLALAAGISIFVTTKIMADAQVENDDGRHHDTGIFKQLGDPKEGLIVNVGGPRSGKFLKTTIVLEMNPNKKSVLNEETNDFQPDAKIKIEDITTQFLRAAKLDDFDALKQDELKKQLKDALNAELGNAAVYDVYITSFLLQ